MDVREERVSRHLRFYRDGIAVRVERVLNVEDVQKGCDVDEQRVGREVSPWAYPIQKGIISMRAKREDATRGHSIWL